MDGSAWSFESLPKVVLYAAVQLVIGIAVTRWLLIRFASSSLSAESFAELDRTLLRFGLFASGLALAALLGRAFMHTVASFGAADALHWDNLRLVAFESRWGRGWRLQTIAAGGLLLSTVAIRFHRRAGWLAFSIAALVLCATIPLLGHGATGNRLILHVVHLLAVSAWLGTLAVIVMLGLGNRARDSRSPIVTIIVPQFSRIALTAAAFTLTTGTIAAAIYLDASPANLVTTSYGRTLLVKTAAFGGISICGWSNWRRVRTGEPPRRPVLFAELAFATAVVLVTSVLTETEHP